MRKLTQLTIKQASEGLRARKFSAKELVAAYLDAIKEKDSSLHAYLEIFAEEALNQAKEADEILQDTDTVSGLPLLFGIPLAVKDNILIEGKKCTAGSKILQNYRAAYDASVIRKLKEAGVIFLGKTNLDEFAMGSSTENSAFGPTRNPYDESRVAGGSSGGSSAAVAAGLAAAALGSDTGGSIRQPASFCGIVGFKPTYGRVSRHGLIAMASSLDQIGPMARTVEDAKIIFETVAEKDDFDATAVDYFRPESPLEVKLSALRIGVPREYFGKGLAPEVEEVIKSVVRKLEDAGAKIIDCSLPHSSYALPCYYIIVPSEISANLARFDGIRYGYSEIQSSKLNVESLFEVYAKNRSAGFGPEVKRRIMLGTYALSAGYYDAYYLKAQKVRRLIKQDFEKVLSEADVILGPTTPTPAFGLGERKDDPLKMYLADIYTVGANLAGVPAISIPAGFVGNLPVGLQLIGKRLEDERLLDIAKLIEGII